jgi:hypothetical protein
MKSSKLNLSLCYVVWLDELKKITKICKVSGLQGLKSRHSTHELGVPTTPSRCSTFIS